MAVGLCMWQNGRHCQPVTLCNESEVAILCLMLDVLQIRAHIKNSLAVILSKQSDDKSSIDKRHFEPVINGLYDVYNLGTARGLGVEGIEICGKTGTAENFTKTVYESKISYSLYEERQTTFPQITVPDY